MVWWKLVTQCICRYCWWRETGYSRSFCEFLCFWLGFVLQVKIFIFAALLTLAKGGQQGPVWHQSQLLPCMIFTRTCIYASVCLSLSLSLPPHVFFFLSSLSVCLSCARALSLYVCVCVSLSLSLSLLSLSLSLSRTLSVSLSLCVCMCECVWYALYIAVCEGGMYRPGGQLVIDGSKMAHGGEGAQSNIWALPVHRCAVQRKRLALRPCCLGMSHVTAQWWSDARL